MPDPARGELDTRVSEHPDADDRDLHAVAINLRDAADGPLRDASPIVDAIDAGNDFGPVRKVHGARVELVEGAEAEVHRQERVLS